MAATNATQPSAVLDERIAALHDELSPAEAKVAEFIARHREEAVFLSAAEIGRELGKSDVILAIAYERLTPETKIALERGRDLGLESVLITDTLGLALAGRFTVALSARRAGSGMYHQSAITMVVLDALLLALAARDRAASLGAAEDLEALRLRIAAAS